MHCHTDMVVCDRLKEFKAEREDVSKKTDAILNVRVVASIIAEL